MLVPVKVLEARKFCDYDSGRYALGGVEFSRDGDGKPRAAATDSRKLIVVEWDEPDKDGVAVADLGSCDPKPGFQSIIPQSQCEKAAGLVDPFAAKLRKGFELVLIDEQATGERAKLAVATKETKHRIDTLATEGRFPHWQDIVAGAEKRANCCIILDPNKVIELLEVLRDFSDREDMAVELHLDLSDPEYSALMFKAEQPGIRTIALLMPKGDPESDTVRVQRQAEIKSRRVPVDTAAE